MTFTSGAQDKLVYCLWKNAHENTVWVDDKIELLLQFTLEYKGSKLIKRFTGSCANSLTFWSFRFSGSLSQSAYTEEKK